MISASVLLKYGRWLSILRNGEGQFARGIHIPEQNSRQGITAFHPRIPAVHDGRNHVFPLFGHDHAAADEYDNGIGVDTSDPLDQFDLGRFEGKTLSIPTFRTVLAGHAKSMPKPDTDLPMFS